jgi:hypothetical protein
MDQLLKQQFFHPDWVRNLPIFSRKVDFPAPGGPDNPEIYHKVNNNFCITYLLNSKPYLITNSKTE